jgi:hypothetical protein
MKKISRRNILLITAFVVGFAAIGSFNAGGAEGKKMDLMGRIVAIGIPGVSAISPVGKRFRRLRPQRPGNGKAVCAFYWLGR